MPGTLAIRWVGRSGLTRAAADTRFGVIPTNHSAELPSSSTNLRVTGSNLLLLLVPVLPATMLPPLAYQPSKNLSAVPKVLYVSLVMTLTRVRATYGVYCRLQPGWA